MTGSDHNSSHALRAQDRAFDEIVLFKAMCPFSTNVNFAVRLNATVVISVCHRNSVRRNQQRKFQVSRSVAFSSAS